jgi:hypothetical protein
MNMTPTNIAPRFDRNYIAPSWKPDPIKMDAYLKAYSHSCRTCHVAMDNAAAEKSPSLISSSFAKQLVCDQSTSITASAAIQPADAHVMPNAKVTFDRFWLSLDHTVSPPDVADQPLHLAQLFANPAPACPKPTP